MLDECTYVHSVMFCMRCFLRAFGKGVRLEAALRPDALLPHVVIEAAAVLAGVPGERHQQDERAVDQVVVEPVVESRRRG